MTGSEVTEPETERPDVSAAASLRSLSPSFDPEQHEVYVGILVEQLKKTGDKVPLNLALTGHYGSGKSSVLVEANRRLKESHHVVVNLSLPSLGVGDGRIPKDGDEGIGKTNLIQKEIVKQLLYRRKPSLMPASRYNRLDAFDAKSAVWRSLAIGAVVTVLALVLKLPSKIEQAIPNAFWKSIDKHIWTHLSTTLQWISLLLVLMAVAGFAQWLQKLLQQRIRVTELSAGPTKVTLSETTSSYFDEYLDEIVYFFQRSKTTIVIFEDLDRFKDPHIFEALRELNLLLNNAEQTGTKPISFVYAIRDSIFEKLDNSVETTTADQPTSEDAESRRLMSTNRTKFFDIVIPVVPFISHRTSRGLIDDELASIHIDRRPSQSTVDIVAAHLTDMRLIKNVCNEYEIFLGKIFKSEGLRQLSPDRLFASVVYKNIYLVDYEKIRNGSSKLDSLYRAYRAWVSQQTAEARARERQASARLRNLNAVSTRCSALGERLKKVLLARTSDAESSGSVTIDMASARVDWSALTSVEFWKNLIDGRESLAVSTRYASDSISFENLEILMGRSLSIADWAAEDRAGIQDEIKSATSDQREIPHSSIAEAIVQTERLFKVDGNEEQSFEDYSKTLFKDAPLVIELLRAGLIDENYTLYTTQFPGRAMSASAMNFILKAVQPDVLDVDYHFGAGEDVSPADIQSVIDAEGLRLLGGQSVYNIEIFDYLLSHDPSRLSDAVRRLASSAADDADFVDAYLVSGKHPCDFVSLLSSEWSEIFDYLLSDQSDVTDLKLLNAAVQGAEPTLSYSLGSDQRTTIESVLTDLDTVTKPQSDELTKRIADTFHKLEIRVGDLAKISTNLMREMVSRKLYPVTLDNLKTVCAGESISLDVLKHHHESDVYTHVLVHMNDYITAIDAAEQYSVADEASFASILSDVESESDALVEEVARRAADGVLIENVNDVNVSLWPQIAAAHKIKLSSTNVATYVEQHGIDAHLAGWLAENKSIDVDGEDQDLVALAMSILNVDALSDDVKLALVKSLGLNAGSVEAGELTSDGLTMIPKLVQAKLVRDDADAYTALSDDDWGIKAELINVSSEFPNYLSTISLSTKDLYSLSNPPTPDRVRSALLTALVTFDASLGSKGAFALAEWAAITNMSVSTETIAVLARRGAPASAKPVIRLLKDRVGDLDFNVLIEILASLGDPYAQLTSPGRERPRIPVAEGSNELLTRLKSEDIVTKWPENNKKGVYEVSKRHSSI